MTGDELTTLLLRHGLEVASTRMLDRQIGTSSPHYHVEVVDIAAINAPDPQQIPCNVEIEVQRRESRRDRYLGESRPVGYSDEWQTVARVRGIRNTFLTSMPLTSSQLRLRRRELVQRGPVELRMRLQAAGLNVQEALVFHWLTDAELRALSKSRTTPPWQRLDYASLQLDGAATPSQIAQQLPSNVFLQVGDVTTTGLWGCREDEVFVASGEVAVTPQSQGFRADLWLRICQNCFSRDRAHSSDPRRFAEATSLEGNVLRFVGGYHLRLDTTEQRPGFTVEALAARWTVYQQLKPLYDVVDGVAGATSAPMPEDVVEEWQARTPALRVLDNWSLRRSEGGLWLYRPSTVAVYSDSDVGAVLCDFEGILDAVAEARVAAATTSAVQQLPSTVRRWTADDLRRAISSDYEIVAVTSLRADPHTTPKDGRYRVVLRLVEDHGYPCAATLFPRGVIFRYVYSDRLVDVDGVNDSLVADLDDWTASDSNHLVDAIAHTAQHLQRQSRRLDYDGLVALLRRHLGDDVAVTTIRSGASGSTHFDVAVTVSARGQSIGANELPQNVTLEMSGHRLRGTSQQIFDPGRRALVAKQPTYFDGDGDTVTTPEKAPPWLHQMVAEVRAKSASWQRRDLLDIIFKLPYGHALSVGFQTSVVKQASNGCPSTRPVVVSFVNAPAPHVPVCLVRAIRDDEDLAGLTPSAQEQAITQEWCQLPTNLQRNVVTEIVERGCTGLSDEAAAERAYHYHVLVAYVQQSIVLAGGKIHGNESDLYITAVADWCEQFRTRAALLEVDDGTVAGSMPTRYTHRTTSPVTPQQVRKFRDAWESKLCTSSATECAAAALLTTGKVESGKPNAPDSLAVHILMAWCTGLDDVTAAKLTSHYHEFATLEECDRFCMEFITQLRAPLETSSRPSQEDVQNAQKARQRSDLASLQAELKKERLERFRRVADEVACEELTRFSLLEVDEAADPAESVRQWEMTRAQQSAKPAGRVSVAAAPLAFEPPKPQHIDVPTPPHNGVEYVDATHVPQELQEMVKWAGLAAAVGEVGKRREN